MPVISQNLSLPGNVVTGGTIQASDVATLYAAMNAFTIPSNLGVWTQGFVDNNVYTATGGGGAVDFSFASAANKAIFFMVPFSYTAATASPGLILRVNGADASTQTMSFANVSSANGLVVGFIGPHSTDVDRAAFMLGMDDRTAAATLRTAAATVTLTTADRTSVGFTASTGSPASTFKFKSVRFWLEG